MTEESAPYTADRPRQNAQINRTQAPILGGADLADRDESPDLLRWRADILMDEMMLGAVDIAVGSRAMSSSVASTLTPQFPVADASAQPTVRPDQHRSDSDLSSPQPAAGSMPARYVDSMGGAAGRLDGRPGASDRDRADAQATGARRQADSSYGRFHSLFDDRFEADAWGASQPDDLEPILRPPAAAVAVTSGFSAEAAVGRTETSMSARRSAADRRQIARNSNLLPRMSTMDSRALHQEIATMRSAIEAALPAQHDWSIRSRHLLEKAEGVLQRDPERTAEIDYYLQQVRTILDRVRQSLGWSQTYYKRLVVYLGAWSLLGAIVVSASVLYAGPLRTFITEAVGWPPEATGSRQLGVLVGTVFAGALGGALGALLSIRQRRQLEHGFFDRKYSLRGLMLPLLGAVGGLILYLPFGLIYAVAGYSPADDLWLGLIPSLSALAFGYFQESIYGTRP